MPPSSNRSGGQPLKLVIRVRTPMVVPILAHLRDEPRTQNVGSLPNNLGVRTTPQPKRKCLLKTHIGTRTVHRISVPRGCRTTFVRECDNLSRKCPANRFHHQQMDGV